MHNRIKQFFGWLFNGIKALWQIGWKKIMDFVTNIEAANELLDKLEKSDYVIIPEKMSRVRKTVSFMSGCCHSFFNRFFKRTDKEYKLLDIDIPKNWMRGKRRRLSDAEQLAL